MEGGGVQISFSRKLPFLYSESVDGLATLFIKKNGDLYSKTWNLVMTGAGLI